MTDEKIIEMLFERNETALGEIERKYSAFCHTVAANILTLREDREECVNDVLLALWNAIPPERPESLKARFTASSAVDSAAKSRVIECNGLATTHLTGCTTSSGCLPPPRHATRARGKNIRRVYRIAT